MIVITKAGEIRLNESLATSYFFNEKGATFYFYAEFISASVKSDSKKQITQRNSFQFLDDNL
tara:strand:+ start:37197 stop:37382 length:186 start_codon:yes stop_codon:yes gene_type:complete